MPLERILTSLSKQELEFLTEYRKLEYRVRHDIMGIVFQEVDRKNAKSRQPKQHQKLFVGGGNIIKLFNE